MKHISTLLNTQNFGKIHFSGIGGIGMSGLAEIMSNLGFEVQGSDLLENYLVQRLRSLGIIVHKHQDGSAVENAQLIVKSTAIADDNPEIIAAKKHHIPIITRTQMLAELMRLKCSIAISGTHGKTTTTSLTAEVFENANLEPTVINGGIINNRGTNAYLGKGNYLITEADESDATFIKIPSTIGVITNIDPEHLDYYKNFDNLKNAFEAFISNLPFYGFGVLCIDHEEVEKLYQKITSRRTLSYSIKNNHADVFATNIRQEIDGSYFDVYFSQNVKSTFRKLENIFLPTLGIHNISNSLASLAIGAEIGIPQEVLKTSFHNFKGVKRRFTKAGNLKTGAIIIDDYAHHPAEIMATLATAKSFTNKSGGKVVAVFQPHRYSRVENLFEQFTQCFTDAAEVYISDIYPAGEAPIPGVTTHALIDAIKAANLHPNVSYIKLPEALSELSAKNLSKDDILIFMGAGNITEWANKIAKK